MSPIVPGISRGVCVCDGVFKRLLPCTWKWAESWTWAKDLDRVHWPALWDQERFDSASAIGTFVGFSHEKATLVWGFETTLLSTLKPVLKSPCWLHASHPSKHAPKWKPKPLSSHKNHQANAWIFTSQPMLKLTAPFLAPIPCSRLHSSMRANFTGILSSDLLATTIHFMLSFAPFPMSLKPKHYASTASIEINPKKPASIHPKRSRKPRNGLKISPVHIARFWSRIH